MLENHSTSIASALSALGELCAAGGVLVHCRLGRDRTGLIVALLLSAVGVPAGEIAVDFASNSAVFQARPDGWGAAGRMLDPATIEGMRRFTPTRAAITESLEWLRAVHGGAEAYLQNAGLHPGCLPALRSRLVEPRDVSHVVETDRAFEVRS
jgi:hypothetical protein